MRNDNPFGTQSIGGTQPFFHRYGWTLEVDFDGALEPLGRLLTPEIAGRVTRRSTRQESACHSPEPPQWKWVGSGINPDGSAIAVEHYVVVLAIQNN